MKDEKNTKPKKKKREKRKTVIRIAVGVIILALIAVIAAAVIKSRHDLSAGSVISAVTEMWTKERRSDAFEYERAAGVCTLDGGIATVSENGIRTLDKDGDEALLNAFTMSDAHVSSCKTAAIAYDAGGSILKFFNINAVIKEIETPSPIISAGINENGWFAVCTQESGYTSSVTVYNTKATPVYQWYSGSGYILKAEVSGDNK